MPALFDLLRDEKEPAVRVLLGDFMFVYINPYMDGNGRTGRRPAERWRNVTLGHLDGPGRQVRLAIAAIRRRRGQ